MVREVLGFLRCSNAGDDLRAAAAEVPLPPRGVLVDATLGTAGHTVAMLQAHPGCRVVGIDRDAESLEVARSRLRAAGLEQRVTFLRGDFRDAAGLLQPYLDNQQVLADGQPLDPRGIAGALIDAGMSRFQVTTGERGLSFRADAPLDMRYDRTQGVTAKDLVNGLSQNELADLFFQFTDERWARRIASNIEAYRRSNTLHTTGQLAHLVEAAIPAPARRNLRIHPATRVFAALRMAVNDELGALAQGLHGLAGVLAPAGRLVVLTYSSNEDRIAKWVFRTIATTQQHHSQTPTGKAKSSRRGGPARSSLTHSFALPAQALVLAESGERSGSFRILTARPLQPTPQEVEQNPLARSCKLRALENSTVP